MQLHHVRRGRGEPLLLIQGLSGSHAAWGEPLLEALQDDFDLVYYDHRGIGFSPAVDQPFTLADLADDATALLDELGLQDVHVLGISMGGMVAQHLALRHPERLRTLALGCTACGGPGSVLTSPRVVRRLMVGMQSGDKDVALRSSFDVNVAPALQDDEHFAAFRAMSLQAPASMSTIMLQVQAIVEHDVQARLAEVRAPTLVLHGTEDQMLPAENAPIIAQRIPGARLELFEGAGHLFYWEQPERTAGLLRDHMLAPRTARADG